MTTEALAKRLPMVLITAVPGLETRNFEFLTQQEVACGARNWKQAGEQVLNLLQDEERTSKLIERIESFLPKRAAEALCTQILNDLDQDV